MNEIAKANGEGDVIFHCEDWFNARDVKSVEVQAGEVLYFWGYNAERRESEIGV